MKSRQVGISRKIASQISSRRGTTGRLRLAISSHLAGDVFSTRDLLAEGLELSRPALDVALTRLVGQGVLRRAARGLFYVPERHAVLGELPPNIEGSRRPWHVAPEIGFCLCGADAANRLGLSTQCWHGLYSTPPAAEAVNTQEHARSNCDIEARRSLAPTPPSLW